MYPWRQQSSTPIRRCAVFAVIIVALGAAVAFLLRPSANANTSVSNPSQTELAKAGAENDIVLGLATTPVTIIEYASLTCPHCAHFAVKTFPELKKRYIDTGKVRFIFREFPLDPLAEGGFMLARCAGKDRYMAVVEALFASQNEWVVRNPITPLWEIAKPFGFTKKAFDACIANQKVLDSIQQVRDHAAKKFGVNSTPTFFVNGKRLVGDQSIEALANAIEPDLKKDEAPSAASERQLRPS